MNDVFRKLGAGINFDFKRFRDDADRLGIRHSANIRHEKHSLEFSDAHASDSKNEDDNSFVEDEISGNDSSNNDEESSSSASDVGGGDESRDAEVMPGPRLLSSSHTAEDVPPAVRKSMAAKRRQLHMQKVATFRNAEKIRVYGEDIPDPISDFKSLANLHSFSQTLMDNITDCGYQVPTPIQMQAIPVMLEQRELLACAPTGSGKTAAFILPILHQLQEAKKVGFRAVVVSPTRELAKQTFREFQRLSADLHFRIHIINKVHLAEHKYRTSKRHDILVTTPQRLVFLLKKSPPVLDLANVEWLVVDESDKLFEAGRRGFRNQLAIIYKACSHSRRAMFSATYTSDVENWCRLNLDNLVTVVVGVRNSAVQDVEQELKFVGSEYGKLMALKQFIQAGFSPPVLIFVQSKERAVELFHELMYEGVNVDAIHADRPQLQRDNVVKGFRAGKVWVLIATELMGRGIDFKGIHFVINYDFPPSAISYIHRIGRTGRAGKKGKAITYFTEEDIPNLRAIANVMRQAGCEVPSYMLVTAKRKTAKRKDKLAQIPTKRASILTAPLSEEEKKLENWNIYKSSSHARKRKNNVQEKDSEADSKIEKKKRVGKRLRQQNQSQMNAKKRGKYREFKEKWRQKKLKKSEDSVEDDDVVDSDEA